MSLSPSQWTCVNQFVVKMVGPDLHYECFWDNDTQTVRISLAESEWGRWIWWKDLDSGKAQRTLRVGDQRTVSLEWVLDPSIPSD